MAKRGRKPKENTLKLLRGTRSDRLETDSACSAKPSILNDTPIERDLKIDLKPGWEPSEGWDEFEIREWIRIVGKLDAAGVLGESDRAALELYLDAFSRWRMARASIKEHGLHIVSAAGTFKSNPAVNVAKDATAQMLSILGEFGATPATRNRVSREVVPEIDEFSDFLKKKSS